MSSDSQDIFAGRLREKFIITGSLGSCFARDDSGRQSRKNYNLRRSMDAASLIKLIWPLMLIQLAVQVYAVVDLFKKGKTKNLNLGVWLIIILFGEILGAIIYFLVGRSEE